MGAFDGIAHNEKALETGSAKAQQRTSPLNREKTLPNTTSNNAASEHQDGEEQTPLNE